MGGHQHTVVLELAAGGEAEECVLPASTGEAISDKARFSVGGISLPHLCGLFSSRSRVLLTQ